MTTDIEKQFFETFNIEKRQIDCEQLLRLDCKDCKTCKYSVYEYPEITDRIHLNLCCILLKYNSPYGFGVNYNWTLELHKDRTLQNCILTYPFIKGFEKDEEFAEQFKTEIKALFEEG